jgi:hypothetical protein
MDIIEWDFDNAIAEPGFFRSLYYSASSYKRKKVKYANSVRLYCGKSPPYRLVDASPWVDTDGADGRPRQVPFPQPGKYYHYLISRRNQATTNDSIKG